MQSTFVPLSRRGAGKKKLLTDISGLSIKDARLFEPQIDSQKGYLTLVFNNDLERSYLYLDWHFIEEVPQDKLISYADEYLENPTLLYTLFMNKVEGYKSPNDPLEDFITEYLDRIIRETSERSCIKKDKEGGYWVQVLDLVAPLEFKDRKLSFVELIFRSFNEGGSNLEDSLIQLPDEEQKELLSMFIRHQKRYDVGYPISVCDRFIPTEKQRQEVEQYGCFKHDSTIYRVEAKSSVTGELFSHFNKSGFKEFPKFVPDSSIFKPIANEETFWIQNDETTINTTLCQMGVTSLFGLPPP